MERRIGALNEPHGADIPSRNGQVWNTNHAAEFREQGIAFLDYQPIRVFSAPALHHRLGDVAPDCKPVCYGAWIFTKGFGSGFRCGTRIEKHAQGFAVDIYGDPWPATMIPVR